MQKVYVRYTCDACNTGEDVEADKEPQSVHSHTVALDGITYSTERCEDCWNDLVTLHGDMRMSAKLKPKPKAASKRTDAPKEWADTHPCDQPGCNSTLGSRASWTAHRRRTHGIITRPRRAA